MDVVLFTSPTFGQRVGFALTNKQLAARHRLLYPLTACEMSTEGRRWAERIRELKTRGRRMSVCAGGFYADKQLSDVKRWRGLKMSRAANDGFGRWSNSSDCAFESGAFLRSRRYLIEVPRDFVDSRCDGDTRVGRRAGAGRSLVPQRAAGNTRLHDRRSTRNTTGRSPCSASDTQHFPRDQDAVR